MKILAIETSCDETAISIVEGFGPIDKPQFTILAQQVSSQIALHAPFGGVVPSLAKREHGKNLVPILLSTLKEASLLHHENIPLSYDRNQISTLLEREPDLLTNFNELLPSVSIPEIDLIAVTTGPGLEPALWVGVNFARALSLIWDKPALGINHMEGHIVSPLLVEGATINFPALALLISGGHTELVLVNEGFHYQKIGQTRDDAVGEAFDKVARLLDLPYPGGPQISKLAQLAREKNLSHADWSFPRPMIHSSDFDFSFSGIKTAVLYAIQKKGSLTDEQKMTLAREFEDAVIEVLLKKTLTAIDEYQIETLIIGGGVIANQTLRTAFETTLHADHPHVKLLIPEFTHATDNASMIAAAAYIRQFSEISTTNPKLEATGNTSL